MKTLLVRLSSMGDLIHTLPAVDDLSRMRPDIELHWLCEEGFADIARLHPFVRQVHVMKWRRWRQHLGKLQTWHELRALGKTLRSARFDRVVDSQGLFKSAAFARQAHVPVSGLDWRSAREGWVSLFYARKYFVRKGQDAVLRNRLLFARVFDYALPEQMSFGVVVPESGRVEGLAERYYVALHATSKDSKLWLLPCWVELLERLHRRDGCVVYLPWGNDDERARAQQIADQLPFAVVCDRLSLLQAAWLLRGARAVIGVDTGLLHLANALDKPLVGIYTDSDPVKTGVQVSERARNVGGIGQQPTVNEVDDLLKLCLIG